MEIIQSLPDNLQMSREYALLGNYDTALVYFDGAISQIQQYASPRHGRSFVPWPAELLMGTRGWL